MTEIKYESLAAKKDLGEDDVIKKSYFYALDEAFKERDNKNIAITGGYGAGKSTIIESYFEKNDKKAKKMMRVSIATFQLEQNSDPNLNENLLEQQILQQLFYQVNPDQIPNSRFTKISDLNFWYVFRILVFLMSTIIFTYLLISNEWMNSLKEVLIDWVGKGLWSNVMLFLGYIILTLLYAPAIYLMLMIFRKLGVSKFGIANANIEFKLQDGNTVFNNYMDEIIYLFHKSKYKYIIFEDLDRFKNLKIYESLRSLNTTLNNSALLKDSDIKFIYALKDDIFTNEDESELINNRTKFFDFIIPTIKVMHSSNAESFLLGKLKDVIEEENSIGVVSNQQKISKKLIEDLSLFINDMRTLINICNEFQVYRTRLEDSSVIYDQLFAFIVYKNIYPKDYSHLLENKGLVYRIFNNKTEIISNLKNKISELKNKTKNGIGNIITSKEDVAMLFARKQRLMDTVLKQEHNIILNMTSYSKDYTAVGISVLDYIMNNGIVGQFGVYSRDNHYNMINSYSNLEEFVTIDNTNFLNLYKDFDRNIVRQELEVDVQIKNLEKKIKNIQSKSISRLMLEDKIDLHVDLSNKGLLQLLIRNNWLNESYEDYLSVFQEGSLKKLDIEFIQAVKRGLDDKKHLDAPLKSIEKISKKIRVDDISSVAVLNIYFIKYLLEFNTEENNEKLSKIINILYMDIEQEDSEQEKKIEEYIEFLESLRDENDQSENLIRKFLKKAITNDIDIWDIVVMIEDIPIVLIDKYVNLILMNADSIDLEKLKSIDNLRHYISKETDVTNISLSENFLKIVGKLDIKFSSLIGFSDEVLACLIEIDAYEITLENLSEIFKEQKISIELIEGNKSVEKYTFNNFDILIDKVLVFQSEYNENEEVLINFINTIEEEDYSILEPLIVKWNGTVSDLSAINPISLLEMLYKNKKFSLTWSNIKYCTEAFKNSNISFKIGHLLSTDENWLDLIENSTNSIQEVNANNGFYNGFVNSILELGIQDYSLLEMFIKKLNYPVKFDTSFHIKQETLNVLIDNELLIWDKSVYIHLESLNHKNKYVLDKFKDAKNDISSLISENEMEWSLNILEIILEEGNIDEVTIKNFLINKVSEILPREFKFIIEKGFIRYDNDILQSLLNEPNKSEVVIEYLLFLLLNGYVERVIEVFNEEIISWDNTLFEELRKISVDAASIYLLDNQDKIDSIQMDQKLFEGLIKHSADVSLSLSVINNNYRNININSVVSKKIYEQFQNNSELVIDTLDKVAIIGIIRNLPIEKASTMLLELLKVKHFDREETFIVFSQIQTPFNEIKRNGKKVEIDTVHNNISELLEYIKINLQVILDYTKEEQGYTVRNKRK
jgi:hypothetical protein